MPNNTLHPVFVDVLARLGMPQQGVPLPSIDTEHLDAERAAIDAYVDAELWGMEGNAQ